MSDHSLWSVRPRGDDPAYAESWRRIYRCESLPVISELPQLAPVAYEAAPLPCYTIDLDALAPLLRVRLIDAVHAVRMQAGVSHTLECTVRYMRQHGLAISARHVELIPRPP